MLKIQSHRERMSQNLPQHPICEVPEILCPHLLDPAVMLQLAKDRLQPAADSLSGLHDRLGQFRRLPSFGRHRQLQVLSLGQFLLKGVRLIGPISYQQARIPFGQLSNQVQVMDVGRGQIKRLDHSKGIDFHMEPEPIKGLLPQLFAVRGQPSDQLRPLGAGKATHRDREAINDPHGIRNVPRQMAKPSRFFVFGLNNASSLIKDGPQSYLRLRAGIP